jgi:cyclophilin family peptidyl-prolyl cis-trans isomerase
VPVSQKPRKSRNRTAATAYRSPAKGGPRRIFLAAVIGMLSVGLALLSVFSPERKQRAQDLESPTTLAPNQTTTTALDPAGGLVCPKPEGEDRRNTFPPTGPPQCLVLGHTYKARITTDAGAFVVAIDPSKGPKAANVFVVLSRFHFYDDLTFHAAVPGFFVQSGDPSESGVTGPGFTFDDQLPPQGSYKAGMIAMANQKAGANGSQFLILAEDAPALQSQYPVFGQVVEGLDVVRKIANDGAPDAKPKVVHRLLRVQIIETQ